MHGWRVGSRGRGPLRLANRSHTLVWVSPKVSRDFDLDALFEDLRAVGFPIHYTDGLTQINFTILGSTYFGLYSDGEIWIDSRRIRRRRTILETFIHEVAHHLDLTGALSKGLAEERVKFGRHVHCRALGSDDEYLARGFEKFYSRDPAAREKLRGRNPRLYRRIRRIHNIFASK